MGDSWRWQLRDSEGQWVKMGSKVKWLSRGKWFRGTVTGSPRPDYATIKPEGGGPSKNIDTRRISVEVPALPAQSKSDAGVGRPTRVPKPKGVPAAAKTPDPEQRRRQWWLERTGSPGPTGTPEQIEALSPVDESLPLKEELRASENKRRDLLKIAAEAKPGTHVWRGETLSGSPQDAASIGIHWSASPSPVITKAPDMIGAGQTDVIWHGVIEKDTKAIPRAHAMWRGIHRSMDSEAEVRLHPGTHVRLLGVRVDGKYQKVDRVVPIQNLGDLGYEGLDINLPEAPQPHAIMEAEEVVKVKDAQPEAKSPAVQAAEKKALAVKTDTRLAEIYEASLDLKGQQERLAYDIHRSGGSVNTAPKYSGKKVWARSLDEAMTDFQGTTYERSSWERSVAKYQANEQKLDALNKEAGELNTVYLDAGTWTRAFLVTNKGGHVHRSMSCSTCYPTTRFHWLPEYSGSDENQIVDDAGERACTVCYPSAPVKTLSKPTKIFSEDEKQQAIARQERAASKVAKDAKVLNNPDGSDLMVKNHYSVTWADHLRTDVSARNWYVKNAADLQAKHAEHIQAEFPITKASLEKILTALAAKHGKTVAEIRAELAPKVAARVKKDAKERAAAEAMWQTELKARGL